eukprot:scaffold67192_cov32-Tisochrysis_lutea.AAC.6
MRHTPLANLFHFRSYLALAGALYKQKRSFSAYYCVLRATDHKVTWMPSLPPPSCRCPPHDLRSPSAPAKR